MRLTIMPLPKEVTEELLRKLAEADGRRVKDVFVPQKRGLGFVTASVEECVQLVSVLNGVRLCDKNLRVVKSQDNRRRHRDRALSRARQDEAKRMSLRSPSMGSKAWVTAIEGPKALVQTGSSFHDPRRTIGKSIAEALDPIRAPKTVMEYYALDPIADIAPQEPGPETKRVLAELETKYGRAAALRGSMTRIRNRKHDQSNSYKGITSDFVEKTKPSKEDNALAAEDFLRKWLSDGPRDAKDIQFDARRDEIPLSVLRRALRALGGHSDRHGRWTLEPLQKKTQEADKVYQPFYPAKHWWILYGDKFEKMDAESEQCDSAEFRDKCNQNHRQIGRFLSTWSFKDDPQRIRVGFISGKKAYFIRMPEERPIMWLRFPDDYEQQLIRVEKDTLSDRAYIINARSQHKKILRELGVGEWDSYFGLCWFNSVKEANRALGRVTRACAVLLAES